MNAWRPPIKILYNPGGGSAATRSTRHHDQTRRHPECNPNHRRSRAPANTSRGDQAQTQRSCHGLSTMKGSASQFGYRLHILVDKDWQFTRWIETTVASLHDSRIDLFRKGQAVYRDKGYFSVKPRASGIRPCTAWSAAVPSRSRRTGGTQRSAEPDP